MPTLTAKTGATRPIAARATGPFALQRTKIRDAWERGERHLAYTLIAICIVLSVGVVVVPLSIPDSLPASAPDPTTELAATFVASLPATAGTPPTVAQAATTYGADGGVACTGTNAQMWSALMTSPPAAPAGATRFDQAAWKQMQVAHTVYCPLRAASAKQLVATRLAAARRARAAAADAM